MKREPCREEAVKEEGGGRQVQVKHEVTRRILPDEASTEVEGGEGGKAAKAELLHSRSSFGPQEEGSLVSKPSTSSWEVVGGSPTVQTGKVCRLVSGNLDRHGNLRSKFWGRPFRGALVGVAAGFGSNRRVPGARLIQRAPTAQERLQMCEAIRGMAGGPEGVDPGNKELWQAATRRFQGYTKRRLLQFLAQEERDRQWVERLQVGLGSRGSPNKKGSRLQPSKRRSDSKGVRAPGGGRKNLLLPFYEEVKRWHAEERVMNHQIDPRDVFEELRDRVQGKVEALEAKEAEEGGAACAGEGLSGGIEGQVGQDGQSRVRPLPDLQVGHLDGSQVRATSEVVPPHPRAGEGQV